MLRISGVILFIAMASFFLFQLSPPSDEVVLGQGYQCPWGAPDCNPCVRDVEQSFENTKKRGEVMGFNHGSYSFDVALLKHWQGVQRMMAGNGQYMVFTRSSSIGGAVNVVKIESRDIRGLWFGSNRQNPTADWPDEVAPPYGDKIVAQQYVEDGYVHAGGLQAIGNFVAVSVEGDNDNALVEFYRVFDNPERLNFYKLEGNTFSRTFTNSADGQEGHAGAVAITRLREREGSDYSRRYVMAVCGYDCEDMDFYVSEFPDLVNPGEWIEFDTISNVPGQSTHEDYQNINFINQCDGKLFLAGFGKDVSHDEIELWEVTLTNENPDSRHGLSASMTRIGEYHKICNRPGINRGNQCNFSAGAGSFIGRDGEIIVYAVEHYDDGPAESIKFEEFRQIDPQSCGGYSDSWVELYDDEGADESDRSVIITYRDWYSGLRDYSDFDHLDDFGDRTTSFTYCVASGTYFSLFEDKNFEPDGQSPEDQFTFQGHSGFEVVESIKPYSCGTLCGWNDRVSSFEFQNKGAPVPMDPPDYPPENYPYVYFVHDYDVKEPESGTLSIPITAVRSGTTEQLNQGSVVFYCDNNWSGYAYSWEMPTATPDEDYVATDCVNPLVLTFNRGESTNTFNLLVNADAEREPIERYVGHSWSDTATTYTIHGVQITIQDFNNTIGGMVINYNSDEDSYTNNIGTTVHTRVMTLENTAFGDRVTVYKDGYFTMPTPLIPGDPYNLEIVEVFDANPEELHDEEMFNCEVVNGNGVMGSETITNIVVDCSRTLSFNSDSSTFQEGSAGGSWHTIRVELDAPAGQNIIIPYSLSGNAYHIWNPGQGTGDYYINPSGQPDEIKIHADSSHADIHVWIEDDADPEGDETLIITLGSPSAGADFDADSIIRHTLTIKDDDSTGFPVYSFASDLPNKGIEPQTETTYTLLIILSEPSTEDILIQISLDSSSTASIFDDFELTGDNVGPWDKGFAPLIIPAGSTSSEIGLVLKPDTLDELSETIILDLAAPGSTPGNAVFGAPSTHTFTITDDETANLILHLLVKVQGLETDNFLEVYSPSISFISTIVEDGEYMLPYEYHMEDTWSLGFQLNNDGSVDQECSVVLETGDSQNDEGFILGSVGLEDVARTINCTSEGGITSEGSDDIPIEDHDEEDGSTICRPSMFLLLAVVLTLRKRFL